MNACVSRCGRASKAEAGTYLDHEQTMGISSFVEPSLRRGCPCLAGEAAYCGADCGFVVQSSRCRVGLSCARGFVLVINDRTCLTPQEGIVDCVRSSLTRRLKQEGDVQVGVGCSSKFGDNKGARLALPQFLGRMHF